MAWSASSTQRGISVFRPHELEPGAQHLGARPIHEPLPHRAHEDQRCVLEVAHLQELPDHHRLQHRADAAGSHDVRVGHQDKLMQAREEGLVLEGLHHERIHFLLEGQVDADADALTAALGLPRAFVGGAHQSRPATGDDVAVEGAQLGTHALDPLVHPVLRIGPRGTEHGNAVASSFGGPQARQVVHGRPEAEQGVGEDALDAVFVVQAHDAAWGILLSGGATHRVGVPGVEGSGAGMVAWAAERPSRAEPCRLVKRPPLLPFWEAPGLEAGKGSGTDCWLAA